MHAKPPNILYLNSHDTGRYVQPYGNAIPTPNIQWLADQGVVFRNAFCAALQAVDLRRLRTRIASATTHRPLQARLSAGSRPGVSRPFTIKAST